MTNIQIRQANKYDLWALERLLALGIQESEGLLPGYDELDFVHTGINMIVAGLVFVAVDIDEKANTEKIVGCLNLEANSWAWNKEQTILESVHFYVIPEARGKALADGKTRVWEGLLAAGKHLADAASNAKGYAVPLMIRVIHKMDDQQVSAKDELFKRAGLSYVGGTHLYVPQPVTADKAA